MDLTLVPLYRVNGQDQASLPGLMAAMPPRRAARSREHDRLIVYLHLTGNVSFSTGEYMQFASRATVAFYDTHGSLTSALRAAAESINKPLFDRNMASSGRGQYVAGMLILAAIRDAHVTLLLSGPVHTYLSGSQGLQDISDAFSGKGLGLNPVLPFYFSQAELQAGDRMIFSSKIPAAWESALKDASPASLEAVRRRLMTLTSEDLNAALLYAAPGSGLLTVLRPASETQASTEEAATIVPEPERAVPSPLESKSTAVPAGTAPTPEVHTLQPSAYAIPLEPEEEIKVPEPDPSSQSILDSLPRLKPMPDTDAGGQAEPVETEAVQPRLPSERTRQTARKVASGLQFWRQSRERIDQGLRRFLPRLLPGSGEAAAPLSSTTMAFVAILIPLVVVTIASLVYFRYGRSVQYEEYLVQARDANAQVQNLTDPALQREALQRELFYLDKADSYSPTDETRSLRQQAQASLDQLQGISRLQFQPVLSSGTGVQISRLAANENDLYLLDAQRGGILRIALNNGVFQPDSSFTCAPGSYGGYTVGSLVDILAMPTVNSMNATVLGIDASGNLLYCTPGSFAQAIPLPPPDTNWGRVKAFTLDSGNLYVLDSQARAVWVYVGKDGTFVDRPYFFFGGQIPTLEDAIDLAVSGDDLYILHSDGHLSTCSYSRIQTVPTRCVDPAPLINPFPAYRDVNLFTQAHFTQMMFTPAPDSSLLLLDSDGQGLFRFTARTLELQNQLRPQAGSANPLPAGHVGAMTVGPNHVLYFAVQDRVYFAADLP